MSPLSRLHRFVHSWQLPAALILLLIAGVLLWALPRRIDSVTSAGGDVTWPAAEAPPTRQVLWQPPEAVADLIPDAGAGSLIAPRLTDGGATLYFTYRPDGGDADVYVSRLAGGRWQPAEPVPGINTDADEVCSCFSPDGRTMYLYSDRPGGLGGADLYACARRGDGWGTPTNLGPAVNSPVHEYDPAVSPDGLSLLFSSNRTKAISKDAEGGGRGWAVSMRAPAGGGQFDIYLSRRADPAAGWPVPEPVRELNRADANEGAPFVAPSGNFVYFASDRPARPGGPKNLDIYRARWAGGRFRRVEPLGRGVNTPAQESEPGLSPEGFTLLFSSDRGGAYRIYQTQALEVYASAQWDTRRWDLVVALWWKVLLLTLAFVALVWLVAYFRGWLFEKATAARFLVASLILHLLLVIFLGAVPLATHIVEQVSIIQASGPAPQPLPEQQQSQQAYAKVADLGAVEPSAIPEITRQSAEPAPAADPDMVQIEPTVPLDVARSLPPDRVQFVPRPTPSRPTPTDMPKRQTRTRPLDVAAATPAEVEPLPAVQKPVASEIAQGNLELGRQDTAESAAAPELPRQLPQMQSPRPTPIEIAARGADRPVRVEPSRVPLPVPRRQPDEAAPVAPPADKVQIALAAKPSPKEADPAGAGVSVPRRDSIDVTPTKVVSMRPDFSEALKLPKGDSLIEPAKLDPGLGQPAPTPLPSPLVRSTPRAKLKSLDRLPPPDPGLTPIPAAPTPAEQPIATASVEPGKKSPTELPEPDLSGQVQTVKLPPRPAPRVGPAPLADVPFKDLPKFDPARRGGLERRLAPADQVAAAKPHLDAKSLFMLRDPETREDVVKVFGGSTESEAAVERGLKWLADHQNPDGSWSLHEFKKNGKRQNYPGHGHTRSNTAATGLALLPFLGAGYTHTQGKYRETIDRGLHWLVGNQKPNGDLFARGDTQHMYSHGIASIALCEAFAMTQDPELRGPAQKAVDFIVWAQHPQGGWRYNPRERGDTSVFGWQLMALKSGELGGLSVPPEAFEKAKQYLKSVEGNGQVGGQFGYTDRGVRPTMTAQGLLALQLMGIDRHDPRTTAGADYLLQFLPKQGQESSYYWYHANQVMYHLQGKYWSAWNDKLRDLNVQTQIKDGDLAGTWNPADSWEHTGGRLFATSLRLLMLEVYYRHLPLYQQLER